MGLIRLVQLISPFLPLVLVGALACGASATAPGRASNPYGVLLDSGRTTDPAAIRETFVMVREAAIGSVRTPFLWALIEPTPGRFHWARYDAIAEAARANDIEILGILGLGTPWASRDPAARDDKLPPRDPELFARYVDATVARYRSSIAAWEVWNEPDHADFWKGSAEDYARLLALVYPRIKAANPAAKVVLGGLAQGGSHDPRFLDSVLAVCRTLGQRCFDVFAFHTNFRDEPALRRQFADNRRRLAAHGAAAPIWITEASYTSDPRHQRLRAYQGGDVAQGRYLVDHVSLSLALGAERVFWATMYDYREGYGEYTASGLMTADGRPKPAYGAYRRLATGR